MKTEYITTEAERRYRKTYYTRNRDQILAKAREKYNANPDGKRKQVKEYDATHDRSDYFREYQRKRKELLSNG